VHDLPAKVDSSLHQLIAGTAQRFVELSHDAKGKIIDLLLLVGSQTAVDGARHPLADAQPVLILDGGVQIIEGAKHAGICFGLQLLPQAVKGFSAGLFDLLSHLHGAVCGDGLDPLDGHEGTVHDVVVDLGDDLLLGLGAVGQGLGDGLGGGLDPVCQRLKGGSDCLGGLPHRLHGLLDGLGAVRSNLCDGLDILQHTIHHLPGSLGDGLFLLLFAVGKGLVDRLHRAGDAILDRGGRVGDGLDYGRGDGFGAGAGLFAGGADCRCGFACGLGDGLGGGLGGSGFFLRLLHTLIVELSTLLCGLIQLGTVIVVHVAVVGSIVGFLCRTDTVFQVCQCSRRAPDFGDQLIDPVHHRADGVLCDLFHRRKCGVDGIAECLAGLIGRHETRRQSRQQGHHQTDGVRLENRVQTCLRDCKAGRPGFGGFVSSGHGRGRGCVDHFDCSSGGYIALVCQECRSGSGHNSSRNADGLLELGHLLVAVEEGDHHLVQLDHQLAQRRKQAAGQLTGQGADIILQGGHAPAEGLAGFQHAVVELSALTGGGFHSRFQLAEADLAIRDALVQVGHALAGGIADLVQRVEARIDHHVDVFQRDLLRRGHLAVGAGQGLQLFGVAQRDIAQPLQHAGGVVCRNAELQKGLGAAGQVVQ